MKWIASLFMFLSLAGAARAQALPYNTVDCDNANGNPKLCTIESDEPERVWVIIGSAAGGFHCDNTGCTGSDGYWTGTEKEFDRSMPAGWSPNWKDAKQYGPNDDPDHDIPNGMHCCYAEYPTPIDPKTGKLAWSSR